MKYLPLIWAGVWRKPGRTILILLQVALAFALFGVLQGLKTGVEQAAANTRADVLFVAPAVFGAAPLPISHLARLKSIPGVKRTSYADVMIGNYQKPDQTVAVVGIETSNIWVDLAPEIFSVAPRDMEALRKTRTGALISADIGKKYGWHIGDRIPVTSSVLQNNGSGTWIFDIVGTFIDREPGESGLIVTSYTYLDESRARNKGTVRNFYAVIADPKHAADMADAIDRVFANSSAETKTTSFRELSQQLLRQIGDLNLAIRSIVSAVLGALLFSISTLMMQAIRERTPELAVLKTLGFSDGTVFWMVVAEALSVCMAAALIGLGLAMGVFPYAGKFVPGLSMPMIVIVSGLVGAVLMALISAAWPAARAARLNVVDALAGR